MSSNDDAEKCGTLYDDLDDVAHRVARVTGEHPVLVWADELGTVNAIDVARAPSVPAAWVAGTFDDSAKPSDIRQDLHTLLHERVKRWILD